MIDISSARIKIREMLSNDERRTNKYPSYNEPEQYVIDGKTYTREERFKLDFRLVNENEYCWVFGWNTKLFYDTGISEYSCIGNAPLLVDKSNCDVYITGIDWPVVRIDDFVCYKKGKDTYYNWPELKREIDLNN